MHLFLQMSKLQETTSYFDENAGRVGVKSDTAPWSEALAEQNFDFGVFQAQGTVLYV